MHDAWFKPAVAVAWMCIYGGCACACAGACVRIADHRSANNQQQLPMDSDPSRFSPLHTPHYLAVDTLGPLGEAGL
jgi:hypothetical protein